MGDTGSMIIGFLLSVFVIRFLNVNNPQSEDFILKSPVAIALSVIVIPLFDTIRVCLVRIWNGKSIFRGDNNHIHHSMLRISGSHLKSTFLILCVNVILIILTVILRNLGDLLLIFGLILIIYSISALLVFIQKNELKTMN
jgi:UDP-N-acetylmuramyl pentapeptide phosphotransferase/UDP-N-acetylglucosamine-1-phosphate transferase